MSRRHATQQHVRQGHGNGQAPRRSARDAMAAGSEHLSRTLSDLLRRRIALGDDNFVSLENVLRHLKDKGYTYTRADVLETVRTSYKNAEPRFELNAQRDQIRATQKVRAGAPKSQSSAGNALPAVVSSTPGPPSCSMSEEQFSKCLSCILRKRTLRKHDESLQAQMTPDNALAISAIMQHFKCSRDAVLGVVDRSCKGGQPRFEIDKNADSIRATSKVSSGYAVSSKPAAAYREGGGNLAVPEYWKNLPAGTAQQLFGLVLAGEAEIEALRIGMTPGGSFGGRDQRTSGDYTDLDLFCAWRIEHPGRWGKFAMERENIRKYQVPCLQAKGISIPRVEIRDEYQEMMRRLPANLDAEINEVFLSHTPETEAILPILNEGLNERFSSGIFGDGTYFAEDVAKNDQYCTYDVCRGASHESFQGPWNAKCACEDGPSLELHRVLFDGTGTIHPGEVFYVFFCRVVLGCPILTQDGYTNMEDSYGCDNSIWASEQRELAPIAGSSPPVTHHSLIAETGDRIARFREFVIYHGDRIYPEYLVAYRRV